jgi:hypothetical protein
MLTLSLRLQHEQVTVDSGDWWRVVPDIPKQFNFNGYGVATSHLTDTVFWTQSAVTCAAAAAVPTLRVSARRTDSALVLSTATAAVTPETSLFPVTADPANGCTTVEISFPAAAIATGYKLCYAFASEPFMGYPLLGLTVVGIRSVAAVTGSPSTIVPGQPKALVFSGTGASQAAVEAALAVDDYVWWANSSAMWDSDCADGSTMLTGPQAIVISSGTAVFTVSEQQAVAVAGVTWRLCYRSATPV